MGWVRHEYANSVARSAEGIGISMRRYSSSQSGFSIVIRIGSEAVAAAKMQDVERVAVMLGDGADQGKARIVPVAEGGFSLKHKGSVCTTYMRPWAGPSEEKREQVNCDWRVVTPNANSRSIEFDLPGWARPKRIGSLMAA